MSSKEALEKITNNLSQLLKNRLSPKDDSLVLEAQEIALQLLHTTD